MYIIKCKSYLKIGNYREVGFQIGQLLRLLYFSRKVSKISLVPSNRKRELVLGYCRLLELRVGDHHRQIEL